MNEEIANSIRRLLPRADAEPQVEVDVDGNRATITVVSQTFEGMSRVQKQQAVYACIDGFIKDGRLHAVSIRAFTPQEAAPS
jgi:acid stress-induced BolA-like protein IbaG/YrbA